MLNPNVSPFAPAASAVHGGAQNGFWRVYLAWVVATLIGFAAGVLLLMLPANRLGGEISLRSLGQVILMLGLPSSIAQWWVLRRCVNSASLWPLATLGGTVLALIAATIFSPYEPLTAALILALVSVAQAASLAYFAGRPQAAALFWVLAGPVIIVVSWGAGLLAMAMTGSMALVPALTWYDAMGVFTAFVGIPFALLGGLYVARTVQPLHR